MFEIGGLHIPEGKRFPTGIIGFVQQNEFVFSPANGCIEKKLLAGCLKNRLWFCPIFQIFRTRHGNLRHLPPGFVLSIIAGKDINTVLPGQYRSESVIFQRHGNNFVRSNIPNTYFVFMKIISRFGTWHVPKALVIFQKV